MTDFSIESGVRIPDREKREAKRDLEQSIGDVTIDVQAAQSGPGRSGGSSTASLAGGAGVLDALDDQTDLLADIHDELQKIGTTGGGGGGGGGLLGGSSGVAVGSLLAGGGGGILGSVLSKGKSGLGSILKGRGSLTKAVGRSPFTLLSQTADMRDVSPSEGGPGGPVTTAMGDVATGDFQLKEDFWPDLSPPEDFWPNLSLPEWPTISAPDWPDISLPGDFWPNLSTPDDLWPNLSVPDGLWPNISAPDWPDLSGPEWPNIDLPNDFWPNLKVPSGGIWDKLLPNNSKSSDQSQTASTTGDRPSGSQDTISGTRGVSRSGAVATVETPTGSESTVSGTRGVRRGGAVRDNSSASTDSTNSRPPEVIIQEVSPRIDGRGLEESLQRALDGIKNELRDEVMAEFSQDIGRP